MQLFIIAFWCWAAFLLILYVLYEWYGLPVAVGAFLTYVCCTSIATYRLWQWRWLRQSALIHLLHAGLTWGADVYDARRAPRRRRVLYAVEPHEAVCYGMPTRFGPTSDASDEATRVRMLAHWSFQYVPFVREIYMAFGVVPARRAFFELLVRRKQDIALIPSGIEGMSRALLEPNSTKNHIYVYRPRRPPSCFELAHKHQMLVVPVLSCNGANMHYRWTLLERWPLLSTILLHLTFMPGSMVRTVAAAPLDTKQYASVDALVEAYYDALLQLARQEKRSIEIMMLPHTTEKTK